MTADEVRCELVRILQRAQPPKSDLSRQELIVLKDLNKDTKIIIVLADKGDTTVIMNTVDYHQKIQELLDTEAYKRILRGPSKAVMRKTNHLIKQSSLGTDIQAGLQVTEALLLGLHVLPKFTRLAYHSAL